MASDTTSCVGFMALTPLEIFIAKQNPSIMKILECGWFPIILAMAISSFRGLILSRTVSKHQFKGMAVLTSIICGVGGKLVAIQTSCISTFLHMWSTPGVLPIQMKIFWPNPCLTFCSSEINSVSARVLLFLVVPGHLIFFYLICLVEGQEVTSSKTFVLLYLVAGMIQVVILLYLAEVMVWLTWHQALDPDNHCIPYLMGLGDLLGTSHQALCFLLDWLLRGRADLVELISELVSVPPLTEAATCRSPWDLPSCPQYPAGCFSCWGCKLLDICLGSGLISLPRKRADTLILKLVAEPKVEP
ncbi:Solute carrier family 41 member 3 [Lemmus lemmus]